MSQLTNAQIDAITDAQWGESRYHLHAEYRAYARVIESAVRSLLLARILELEERSAERNLYKACLKDANLRIVKLEHEMALQAQRASAQPTQAALTNYQREVLKFLDGSGPLDGVWFTAPNPRHPAKYWWRTELRKAFPDEGRASNTGQGDSHAI